MSKTQFLKLKEVCLHRKEFITISDHNKYKRCRVQLHRKGIVLRDEVFGSEIKTKKQRLCKHDNFIVAEMDAKFGGYGIVPNFLEDAIVSSHYYLYQLDEQKILPEYLHVVIQSGKIQEQIKAVGSTNYSRVSPKEVLEYKIPCPDISKQLEIIERFQKAEIHLGHLSAELTRQQTFLKKLRQSILQDAVSGKLTEKWRKENPEVEPASELLKRIKTEKDRLVKEKKIKKQKPLPPITEEEIPFELPDGWAWARIGEITNIVTSGSRNWKSLYSESGASFIRSQDIKFDRLCYANRAYVNVCKGKEGVRTFVNQYDWLMIITGANVGKCAYLHDDPGEAYVSQHVGLMRPTEKEMGEFGHLWLIAEFGGRGLLSNFIYGDKPGLNLPQLRNLPIPLPPLPEQKAIVAKVEKLLALCDQLESQNTNSRQNSELLMQAVFKEAFEG